MSLADRPIRPAARRRSQRRRSPAPCAAAIDWLRSAAIACRTLSWLLALAGLLAAWLVPTAAQPALTLALLAGVVALSAGQR